MGEEIPLQARSGLGSSLPLKLSVSDPPTCPLFLLFPGANTPPHHSFSHSFWNVHRMMEPRQTRVVLFLEFEFLGQEPGLAIEAKVGKVPPQPVT